MIKAVIIDDEKSGRDVLANILAEHFEIIEVVGQADDVDSGVILIQETEPQLVFLDIKMPGGTGFDLLEKIPEKDFEVVFITAYDNFTMKAFRFSAIGYLLKPIKIKDLRETVERLEKYLLKDNSKRLKVLVENYGAGEGKIKKLVVPNIKGFEVVKIEDIIRCEGERNYTNIVLVEGKKILVSKTLKEYEELLSEHGFSRIHQSSLINLHHVKKYIKGAGGKVEMSDGVTLQVSQQRKAAFVKSFV